MYEYVVGVVILFIIWLCMYWYRKDLRWPMVWSGLFYTIILLFLFLATWIGHNLGYIKDMVIPGYWDPDTILNLGRITQGLSLEDIMFMFFVGGISTFLYEGLFSVKIQIKKSYKPHLKAIIGGIIIAALVWAVFLKNPIYSLIAFGLSGAFILWFERKDLIKHSIIGGISFMIIYGLAFSIFNLIFPNFIHQVYSLNQISGVIILKIPLEEWLYALSFGMMWAPMYEYIHGERDVRIK